ncbi:MAG: hypothetical protein VR69_10775 [Peptococcaceae bacterium BRH_c4b]|nr:MAG: hypothetical protein VR69_10775 [Peptococcaceae bacterium BRH_c4b]
MTKKPDYEYIYAITAKTTPLDSDCGELCGSICCRPHRKKVLGMYLFPGEETMFSGAENWLDYERHDPLLYDFPDNWEYPVFFVKCTPPCPRQARPLSCRLFPLAPHLLQDGTLLIIHETIILPYRCPLITRKIPLRVDFIETVALTWQELLKDDRIYRLVEEDSRQRETETGKLPEILHCSSLARKT